MSTQDPFAGHRDLEGLNLGPVVTAMYEGVCDNCPLEIIPGDDIRATGDGGWIHADCEELD